MGTSLEAQLGSIVEVAVQAALEKQLPKALAAIRMPPRSAEQDGEVYLTFEEAATIARYHVRTIRRHVAEGTLQTAGLHGNRIARSELDRWMAEMAKGSRGRKGPPPSVAAPVRGGGPAPANDDDISAEVERLLNDQ